jgi:DNA polymerase I-like protein with 3'-5' exonuclease and polymerase domains
MVEICTALFKHVEVKGKDGGLEQMIERVQLYRFVIEKNKGLARERQAREREGINRELDFGNAEQVKARIIQLNASAEREECLDLSVIYHSLQIQLLVKQ